MKIKPIAGFYLLSHDVRREIEESQFTNIGVAHRFVQQHFPHHLVAREGGCITVTNRDRSLLVASFKAL